MPSLTGNKPNQVPLNADLGNLAYQNASSIAGPVTVGGSVTANGVVSDTISEKTSAAGVTIDSVLLKDNKVTANELTINSNNISAENSLGFRNRIINGDMRIAQRGTAAVTTASAFPVDRFLVALTSNDGTFSAQQDSSVPAGFNTSTKITVTTADGTIASTENFGYQTWIEGNNIADLGFGTANAKTVTISFWVRGSVTGTYGLIIGNSNAGTGGSNRSYVSTYTINSADTWEYKTITIAGDTSGTWQIGNLRGMLVRFGLTAGTDFQQAAGSWGTANAFGTSSTVQLLPTLNATWYITGVQLEVGSVATPFERRPYGTELALCQRYYFKNLPGAVNASLNAIGWCNGATLAELAGSFPVTMRIAPTALEQSGTAGNYKIIAASGTADCSSVPIFGTAIGTTQNGFGVRFTVASGLTDGRGAHGLTGGTTGASGYLAWSAEL